MDSRYVESMFARGATVAGRRLRAFSLAHVVALEGLDSPFMRRHVPLTPEALVIALRVCAATDPLAPLGKPTWRDSWLWWRARLDRRFFERVCREFLAYVAMHRLGPKLMETDKKGKGPVLPDPLVVVAALVRHGIREPDAWAMSCGLAEWYFITFAAQEGAEIPLWTDSHEAAARALAAITEAAK